MKNNYFLESKRMIIKPFERFCVPAYMNAYSAKVQAILHVTDKHYEYEYICQKILDKNSFFYILILKTNEFLIGAVEIRQPSYQSQIYAWLNELYWGRSYFFEAMSALLPHYFKKTGEVFVRARIDIKNKRSLAAFERLGFFQLGIVSGSFGPQIQLQLNNNQDD